MITVIETNCGGYYIYQIYHNGTLLDTMSCYRYLSWSDQYSMKMLYEEAVNAYMPSVLTDQA